MADKRLDKIISLFIDLESQIRHDKSVCFFSSGNNTLTINQINTRYLIDCLVR